MYINIYKYIQIYIIIYEICPYIFIYPFLFCKITVDSGIAESRESPSAIINRETKAIHGELRSVLHVKIKNRL